MEAGMQIEEGKFYRTRDGRKVGPVRRDNVVDYPWVATRRMGGTDEWQWRENGAFCFSRPHDLDLVAEWTDEPPAKSPTLAQDGQDGSEATQAQADAEWASRVARNEKDGVSGVEVAREAEASWQHYAQLRAILLEAHDQAAHGKGRIRHANGKPWLEQPIMTIGRDVGLGYPTGQALKKITEAVGMVSRGERDAAVAELLGAIVYAAAAVQLVREMQDKRSDALSRLAEMDADLIGKGE